MSQLHILLLVTGVKCRMSWTEGPFGHTGLSSNIITSFSVQHGSPVLRYQRLCSLNWWFFCMWENSGLGLQEVICPCLPISSTKTHIMILSYSQAVCILISKRIQMLLLGNSCLFLLHWPPVYSVLPHRILPKIPLSWSQSALIIHYLYVIYCSPYTNSLVISIFGLTEL